MMGVAVSTLLRSGAGIREPEARGRPGKALGLRRQRQVGRSREVGHARRQCDVLDRQTADAHQPAHRRGDTAGPPESGVCVQAVEPLDDQQRPHGADDLRGGLHASAAWEAKTHGRSRNSTSTPRASTPWTARRIRSKCTSFTSTPPGSQPSSWASSSRPARRTPRSRGRSRACPPRKATRWRRPGDTIDAGALLPADRTFFTYAGSLTTPPCTEGITWYVLKAPIEMSPRADRRVHEARAPRAQRTGQSRASAAASCWSIPRRTSSVAKTTD